MKDYVKLFSIRQSEKFALFLAMISSFYILSTVVIILVVFGSFVLAGSLNQVLGGDYWGYLIVGGIYLIVIALVVIRMFRMKTPLFYSFFIRLVILILDLDTVETPDSQGFKLAEEKVRHRIETGQIKVKSQVQLLRYTFFESLFKEFIGLFRPSRKQKS
jgi:hypothetical protein